MTLVRAMALNGELQEQAQAEEARVWIRLRSHALGAIDERRMELGARTGRLHADGRDAGPNVFRLTLPSGKLVDYERTDLTVDGETVYVLKEVRRYSQPGTGMWMSTGVVNFNSTAQFASSDGAAEVMFESGGHTFYTTVGGEGEDD